MQVLVLLAALAGGGWWAFRVIGRDLGAGAHVGAKHEDRDKGNPLPPTALATTASRGLSVPSGAAPASGKAGAAAQDKAPHVDPARHMGAGTDPVARALLAAARDHLARKVTPTTYAVDDLRANNGNHLDLIERGLAEFVPLKTALVRHRSRNPQLYGLQTKPAPTMEERRRAWTSSNFAMLLQAFAQTLPADMTLEAGDILLLQRQRRFGPTLAAVVSDVTDEAGNPLAIVMDPAHHAPVEVAPTHGYRVLQRFRLTGADIERMRQSLDLDAARPAGTTL